MLQKINLVEPFFDHSGHSVMLHVRLNLQVSLPWLKVISCNLIPVIENVSQKAVLEVLSASATNLTMLLNVKRAFK